MTSIQLAIENVNVNASTLDTDIYNTAKVNALVARLENVTENSERQWGKMTAFQMCRHMLVSCEIALGKRTYKRQFMGRIFGKMILKSLIKTADDFSKNSPTASFLVIKEDGDLETEKAKLIALLKEFPEQGAAELDGRLHPFFGTISSAGWSRLTYKHFDHHLRQFGA